MTALIESAPSTLSEKALIGALVQDHDQVFPISQAHGITEESFTDSTCKTVWRTAGVLRSKCKIVDIILIAENMGADPGDNLTELARFVDLCPTTQRAPRYAQEVRMAEQRRTFARALQTAQERLQAGEDVQVLAEQLKETGETVAGGTGGLQFTEAADLIETEPPPLDPIIEGCFERGDKVELVAGSKQRKSFFLIDLLFHLAIGRDWLGFKIMKRRRVVYVNLELKDAWIHRRIRRNAKAYGISADDVRGFFRIVNARGKGVVVRNTLAAMMRREQGVDVVAIDPRYKLMLPGEAENFGEGIAGILAMMDDIAEAGPAVLVVHHDSKGDQSEKSVADRGGGSGHSGRDVDCKFTLSPQRDEPDSAAVVESMRRNYAPDEPYAIRWADHRFDLAPDLQPAKYGYEQRKKQARADGKPSIEDCEPVVLAVAVEVMGRGELISRTMSKMPAAARQTVRDSVDALLRVGRLAQTSRAGNKNGTVKYGTPEAVKAYLNPKLPS